MSEQKDGGPAFPGGISSQPKATDDCPPTQGGMSLRDWFAGQVLSGYSSISEDRSFDIRAQDKYGTAEAWLAELAKIDAAYCYRIADAMLAEREKRR